MKILMTGATGFLGTALLLRLRRDGHAITVLSRNPAGAADRLAHEATAADLGLSDRELDKLVEESDVVVNLAGEPILGGRWTSKKRASIRSSRLNLTRRLVGSMQRAKRRPSAFVSASAVGYYGDRSAQVLEESAPPGDGFLAELCRDWEREAQAAATLGVRVVTPRIGVVLGREGGALDQMLTPFRLGVGGSIGSGKQYVSWIHLDDLVELLATAVEDERYEGPINATAPTPIPFSEFARALAAQLQRPAFFNIPSGIIRVAFGEASEVLLGGQRATPARARSLRFDYSFETVEEALNDLLTDDNVRIRPADENEIPDADYLESRRPQFVLETKTEIPKPMAEVFPFFSEARNLALLTPPKMKFRITNQPEGMVDGALIAYRLQIGSVPIRWTTRIEQWTPDQGFVDSQVRGPYRCWWHEHSFHSSPNGVTMVDRVFYAPPLGVLGRALNSLFIRLQLSRVFGYRNAVLRRRFGG